MPNIITNTIDFCHNNLWADEEVVSYLKDVRNITSATAKEWKLGAFPKNPQLIVNLYDLIKDDKQTYSILKKTQTGAESPFFVNRLIIPINDCYGNPEAIIGRQLGSTSDDFPKYWNTPYKKSRSLFGFDKAKNSIIRSGMVFIVEGNFDVITAHQAGLTNVVGASSANLSKSQLLLAARYAEEIIIAFDADEAGQQSYQRIVAKYSDFAKKIGVKLSAYHINHGKDLDEQIRKRGITW